MVVIYANSFTDLSGNGTDNEPANLKNAHICRKQSSLLTQQGRLFCMHPPSQNLIPCARFLLESYVKFKNVDSSSWRSPMDWPKNLESHPASKITTLPES